MSFELSMQALCVVPSARSVSRSVHIQGHLIAMTTPYSGLRHGGMTIACLVVEIAGVQCIC